MADDRPRVLVYDPDGTKGGIVAERIKRSSSAATVYVLASRPSCRDLGAEEVDVCLINMAGQRLDGLAFGAELGTLFPWIETVFWFDEKDGAPAADAGRNIGIRRLIALSHLAGWLDGALHHLARIARARREQLSAEMALPPVPTDSQNALAVPLLEAERRFREAYIRRLIAESENHAAAARKAGLAYSTFCSILRKIDL